MVLYRPTTVLLLLLTCMSCERCAPDKVAQGLSRLTIRNISEIAIAVNDDENCGFSSLAVLASGQASVSPGQDGHITWEVQDCLINYPESNPKITTDCNGNTTSVTGKIRVKARRVVQGFITGSAQMPIIPSGPDAVTIHIDRADFESFKVKRSNSDSVLTMITGSISGTVQTKIAANEEMGVCAIRTRDAKFSDVSYNPSKVRIRTRDRNFTLRVPTSKLFAINGVHNEGENQLSGQITVWDSKQNIPINAGEKHLDPDYARDYHNQSFSCLETIAKPVTYQCVTDVNALAAQGSSRLSIQTLGTIARLIDADTRCGFSSQNARQNASIEGSLGQDGGMVEVTISSPCQISFSEDTVIGQDCRRQKTYASGTIEVTGTKKVYGYLTGDQAQPVVPMSRDPVVFDLGVDFSHFAIWNEAGDNILSVESGYLSGKVYPRMALNKDLGICSSASPVTSFEDLHWSNAVANLKSGELNLPVRLEASNLLAQNGTKDELSNYLQGSMTLNGTQYNIPVFGQPTLDPDFEQSSFDASWSCIPSLIPAQSDESCNFRRVLAQGAARMLVKATGAVATLISQDNGCGFASPGVLSTPSWVQGEPGEQGMVTWDVDSCTVSAPTAQLYQQDCKGQMSFFEGAVSYLETSRIVEGLRRNMQVDTLEIPSVLPLAHQAVSLDLGNVHFEDFVVFDLESTTSSISDALRIMDGQLSAEVIPILAQRGTIESLFDVPTGKSYFREIVLKNSSAILYSGDRQFHLFIDEARLEAFNGSFEGLGLENMLRGTIRIAGETFDFGTEAKLDPAFDLNDFTERYRCLDIADRIPAFVEILC